MSRASQFIEYINRKYEPSADDKSANYTDITIDDKLKKVRKEYQKKLKKEKE